MAGASAAFYLCKPANAQFALEIHQRLVKLCSHVEATRRGSAWKVWMGTPHPSNSRPFLIHLKSTRDNLPECEDEMLNLGIDDITHPSYLEIAAGCNQAEDKLEMNRILEVLTEFCGVAGQAEK